MFKRIFVIIRKITISFFLLYAFNIAVQPLNFIIPINFVSIISISILGVPALFSLILLSILVF